DGVAVPTFGESLVGQLLAAYKSAIKGLVGATTGVHQLRHTTDHQGGKLALISDRSSNISSQPYNAPSQLMYLIPKPGDPLMYSPVGRWQWLRCLHGCWISLSTLISCNSTLSGSKGTSRSLWLPL
ncbi:hypothetical protein Tco_0170794, partial [Tanacetum coccineum]